jgi:uncharacterized protein with NRDE domain
MCTLAIWVRQFATAPLVVAANRDEFFARPATAPVLLSATPRIVGGQDLRAGGTWLGVNEHGVVAGLLNRRTDEAPDPTKRSRGMLLMEVLASRSAADAHRLLTDVDADRYNGFNLLVADRHQAWAAQNKPGAMHLTHLDPGVHLITNLDVNDLTCPKIARSHRLFAAAGETFAADGERSRFRDALRSILSDHTTALDPRLPDALGALCVHTATFGTRCSSLLFAPPDGDTSWEHWFADGPPCRAAYAPALVP